MESEKSMEHKIKMIGLDLDGTVLTEKKELTVRTREAISRALAQGVVVLVATGRPWMGRPGRTKTLSRHALCTYVKRCKDYRYTDGSGDRGTSARTGIWRKRCWKYAGKYDTLQEVYFDGQGYAPADKMNCVEKYHKTPVCVNI